MSDESASIGPYRIERTLGVGGMGEVFLAWDPRLERRVAIKRLRNLRPGPSVLRARLRREARVAASLSHPAIVPVFDLLTEDGVDHIVMAYVSGTSLRQAIRQGTLALGTKLQVARDVAAALAYAHDRGVVHRDVKTENVLLTPEGRAQLGDFGIARRRVDTQADGTLTRTGQVAGTFRAMAPEQARGEPADPRADLFSLGVLLYELFTSVSPFAAASPSATLARVLEDHPARVTDLDSSLPPPLGAMIAQLLEKVPDLRLRHADEVVARLDMLIGGTDEALTVDGGEAIAQTTLDGADDTVDAGPRVVPTVVPGPQASWSDEPAAPAARRVRRRRWPWALVALTAVVVVAVGLWRARTESPPRRHVAVLTTTLETPGDDETGLLAFGVHQALLRTVVRLDRLAALAPEPDIADHRPVVQARALAADEALVSTLTCGEGDCMLALQRVRASDGITTWSGSFMVARDDLLTTARAVEVIVRDAYPHRRSRTDAGLEDVSASDFAAFLRIRHRFEQDGNVVDETLLEALAAIRRRSPRFVDALKLEAEFLFRLFHEGRVERHLTEALARLDAAQQIAPNDASVGLKRVWIEIEAGRLEEAAATLARLERTQGSDVRLLDLRAQVLLAQGSAREAMAMMAQAVQRRPAWRRYFNHAWVALQLGEHEAARTSLEALLERVPEQRNARSLLAQLEMTTGDPERAVTLYQALVDEQPALPDVAGLALAQMLVGQYDRAREGYETLAARLPRHPEIRLNLGDAYALEGRHDEATGAYEAVVEMVPPDAAGWELLAVRAQALAHIGRTREAVSTIQEVLRRAPENNQAAFEAALVYAVTGETTLAEVNAQRALDLGFESRWFRLPWFDVLRTRDFSFTPTESPSSLEEAGGDR